MSVWDTVISPPARAGEQGIVDLFGLHRRYALGVAAVLLVLFCALGLLAGGVTSPIGYLIAYLLLAAGTVALLLGPDDPLAGWATAVIGVTTVTGTALVAWACEPDARQPNLMISGVTALMWLMLCIRGRTLSAWLSFGISVAVLGMGVVLTGPLPGALFGQSATVGILAMATVFARIVRPRAQQLALLARHSRDATEVLDAELALQALRDEQLARLDEGARPLLELIASGATLTPAQVARCRLVEAQLRDRIRAPGLDTPEIAEAAWAARERGVQVVLLDDRASQDAAPLELDPARGHAVRVLDGCRAGEEVTVRLLPRGRELSATITVAAGAQVDRTDFGQAGRPVVR